MNDAQPAIKIYGMRGSAACYSIRDFLHRSDVPFQWIDLASDEQAHAEAQVSGLEDKRLPVCEFPDGTRIERATVRQVLEKLGWYNNPSREEYDLAIYGAGPAGLSAAVYGASEGLKTVVIGTICSRRTGRQQSEDRELSGLSARHQRRGPRRAGPRAGMPVRRGNSRRPRRCPR